MSDVQNWGAKGGDADARRTMPGYEIKTTDAGTQANRRVHVDVKIPVQLTGHEATYMIAVEENTGVLSLDLGQVFGSGKKIVLHKDDLDEAVRILGRAQSSPGIVPR